MRCEGGFPTIHAHQEGQKRVDDTEDGVRESARGDAGLRACFEQYLSDNDQRGFYKHLKSTVMSDDRKARSEQFIMEDGTLLKDKVRVLERWAR